MHWSLVWAAMPLLHTTAYHATKYVLMPFMIKTGLPVVKNVIANVVGETLGDKELTISAAAVGLLMTLFTYYPYLLMKYKVDNANPRASSDRVASRLYAAHQNAVEAFPRLVSALCSVAYLNGGRSSDAAIAALAWLWCSCRIMHWAMYVLNIPHMRTAFFLLGFHSTLRIFISVLFG